MIKEPVRQLDIAAGPDQSAPTTTLKSFATRAIARPESTTTSGAVILSRVVGPKTKTRPSPGERPPRTHKLCAHQLGFADHHLDPPSGRQVGDLRHTPGTHPAGSSRSRSQRHAACPDWNPSKRRATTLAWTTHHTQLRGARIRRRTRPWIPNKFPKVGGIR
jgi:hypothetical protein